LDYSNPAARPVTLTAMVVYFKPAQGMGNAKLENLGADEQKRFRFNAAKSGEVEQRQVAATQRFHEELVAREPASIPSATAGEATVPVTDDNGEPVMTKIYAHSIRGQRPPQIIVEQWLIPARGEGEIRAR